MHVPGFICCSRNAQKKARDCELFSCHRTDRPVRMTIEDRKQNVRRQQVVSSFMRCLCLLVILINYAYFQGMYSPMVMFRSRRLSRLISFERYGCLRHLGIQGPLSLPYLNRFVDGDRFMDAQVTSQCFFHRCQWCHATGNILL
jgi:hypothetical protein